MSRIITPAGNNRTSSAMENHRLLQNKKYLFSVAVVTCIILLIGFFLWNSGSRGLLLEETDTTIEPWYRGSDNAPVRIDVYPDFMCSICLVKERMAIRIIEDFGDAVRLVYHHYPVSLISESIAEALEAAGEQGKFWELHDRLIDDTDNDIYQVISAAMNDGLDPEEYALSKIITEAEAIGLDSTRLIEAINSGRYTRKVRTAMQEAVSAGVTSVSVFINGKEFEDVPATYEGFYAAVTGELELSSDR